MNNRFCQNAGCSSMAVPGSYYCATHKKESNDRFWAARLDFRPSASIRYTDDWPLIRAQILNRDVVCQLCSSSQTLQVHHKVPITETMDRPHLVTDPDALVTLCKRCHGAIHSRMKKEKVSWNFMMHQKGKDHLLVNDGSEEYRDIINKLMSITY